MGRPFYSRRHFARISPPADTPEMLRVRLLRNAVLKKVEIERMRRWPTVTADNVREVLAWQDARIKELEGVIQ